MSVSWEPSAAPPPTKLHTFGDLHSIINLPAALSAFGCSCPLNDTRNRSFSEGRGDSME